MKRILYFLLALLGIQLPAISQTNADLEVNEIRARVNARGVLFHNSAISNCLFEVPVGHGTHAIYTTNFWMAGYKSSVNLKVAAGTDGYSGNDYAYGPIANDYSSQEYIDRYNRVWYITRGEVLHHISNYNNPEYTMPFSITSWPGNGNVQNGEALYLAPYADVNSNGFYDPENGDYPEIRGDMAIYYIMNDKKNPHYYSHGEQLGVELHGMLYGYEVATGSALKEVVFLNVRVFNRLAANMLTNYHLAIYNDFDLGGPNDDYVGTDVALNMTYVYNADNMDANAAGALGYQEAPPAVGCMLLNSTISKSLSYGANSSTNAGNPSEAQHYYNYIRGRWKDGSSLKYGGHGVTGTENTNYIYTGYPELSEGWSEYALYHSSSDRRILMSVGPLSFSSRTSFCLDYAFVYARDFEGTHLTSIAALREKAALVQDFYDSMNFDCDPTPTEYPLVSVSELDRSRCCSVTVTPNPAHRFTRFSSNSIIKVLKIMDVNGSVVESHEVNSSVSELSLNGLKSGVYVYHALLENGTVQTGKLVVI
jgi:hypothetical protein